MNEESRVGRIIGNIARDEYFSEKKEKKKISDDSRPADPAGFQPPPRAL